jgi:PIN domain nuclease of toxin-antitoxin system
VNLLLDTHALIWWLEGSPRLSETAESAIANAGNPVHVSAASGWEILTKHRLGKLPLSDAIAGDLPAQVLMEGFALLDITFRHACLAGALKQDHRDPFDRMLIAQSIADGLVLVSNETLFDDFGVKRLW